MNYCSIDIETTGLDREKCQVIEFAAVLDDCETSFDGLPRFEALILHPHYHFDDTWALHQHAKNGLLDRLDAANQLLSESGETGRYEAKERLGAMMVQSEDGDWFCDTFVDFGLRRLVVVEGLRGLEHAFEKWLRDVGPAFSWAIRDYPLDRMTAAGKLVGQFDLEFLRRGCRIANHFHRRTLDVGPMYARAGDSGVPSTEKCLQRAGLPASGSHRAMDDALDVVRLVRHAWDSRPLPVAAHRCLKSDYFLLHP